MNITKLIIPAAGIGSRFLPITKTIPKEMLPLSNKPAIEYIVQEGHDANLTEIAMVLSPEKNVIKDYFQPNTHLDKILSDKNQLHLVASVNQLIQAINFSYYYQNTPNGLAEAILQCKNFITSDEYFAVALPDDIILGEKPEIKNLMDLAQQMNGMVIAVQEIPMEHISSYGVIAIEEQINERCFKIKSLVEKPPVENAPSNLAIVGRYIFHADLFNFIPQTPVGKSGEILLPETINLMIEHGYPVFAYKISGQRFDTGTPAGWINYILHHANL